MPVFLYERIQKKGGYYLNQQRKISLGGKNIIYNLWKMKNRPLNKGWIIKEIDIINACMTNSNTNDYKVIIEGNPSSNDIVEMMWIKNIYLYTFGNNGQADWTVMMLDLREIFSQSINSNNQQQKNKLTLCFPESVNLSELPKVRTFLYIRGDYAGWLWGMNGQLRAAWINDDARNFFIKYF